MSNVALRGALIGLAVSRLSSLAVFAALSGEVELKPGAVIRLSFPELPPTLVSQATHEPAPALLTARLPDNYTTEGQWPLFVFIAGGVGAKGDNVGPSRTIVGPRDFVVVALPLFQRAFDTNEVAGGIGMGIDDFETLSSAYRTMLGKLLQTVPGIVTERSTLGGFSNGAHATALLVAGRDEFTMEHFRQFVLVEGGVQFLAPFGLTSPKLRNCRFLALRADQPLLIGGGAGGTWNVRPSLDKIFDGVSEMARARGLDWTDVVMRGQKHSFPPEYQPMVGQWIRGETLTVVPPPTAH